MRTRSWYSLGVTTVVATALFVSSVAPASASSLSTTTHITSAMTAFSPAAYTEKSGPRAVSHDGRYSVFSSSSNQLTFNDVNGMSDIFAYDRTTKQVQLISRSPYGPQSNGFSYGATISADGRYVAFLTYATNITPGEIACPSGGPCVNIVVHDRYTKSNKIVNKATDDSRLAPAALGGVTLSYDGRYIAFNTASSLSSTDNNFSADVVVRDLQTSVTTPASVDSNGNFVNGSSETASISYDGQRVAFTSRAPLVSGDTNNSDDIYFRDMQTNTIKRVSNATNGQQANNNSYHSVISGNGTFIAFDSAASNLVPNDTNGAYDVFLYDIQSGTTKRISTTTKGDQGNGASQLPDISHDGKSVIYCSSASNLVGADNNGHYDIFRYYKDASLTRRINVQSGNGTPAVGGGSYEPSVSGDGKAVFYDSDATNLVKQAPNPPYRHLYLTYDPVIDIPFYDPNDILDLLY